MSTLWNWFGLSYAQYLTIPRSILHAMSEEWQDKLSTLLEELDETIDWRPSEGRYWCRLKNNQGRFVADPLMNYRHPDQNYIESLKYKQNEAK